MAMRSSTAAAKVTRISDDDPVLFAAMNAPVEDMPETEQEKRDIEDALAAGHFISGAEVSRMVAARRPR